MDDREGQLRLRAMIDQRDALLRLLQDDDPATLTLLKTQLVHRGSVALPEFRALLADAEPPVARHLREVIARIEAGNLEEAFAQLCAGFGPESNLEEAAWRLSALFLPGEEFGRQRALLDQWGAEVARRLEDAETEIDRIETLVEFLGEEANLRGNEEDYYNISNSLLSEVIDTRLGIPITLSLIYVLVGQRAGIPISGVGLPGHFLVRHGQNFFDPFYGGKRVGLDECRARLHEQQIALSPVHLRPVSAPQFLLRMLNNICVISEKSDPALAEKVTGWMDLLKAANASQ
jgi:hypothetical protein